MKKVFVLFFLTMIAGVAFAQTSSEVTVQTSSAPAVQTVNKATVTDWTKLDRSNKRRWKYSFQANYIDYSYELTQKSDDPRLDSEVECETELAGMSVEYKKQFESGFFNEGMLTFASGSGNLKMIPKNGKEVKFKLDSVGLFEWKMKLGMLIPLSKDGDFKAGPFSGFAFYNMNFNINGKDMPGGYRKTARNYFLAFPLGIRTEYANRDWKFGLDTEYDFVVDEHSFMILDSVDFMNEWSNGYIFQVTGNVSKDFAEGRLTFRLTPFYRYVDYGKCEYRARSERAYYFSPKIDLENTGSSHEFGIRAGVQF